MNSDHMRPMEDGSGSAGPSSDQTRWRNPRVRANRQYGENVYMDGLCAVFIDFENFYYFLVNQRKDLNPTDASLDVVEQTRAHLEATHGLRVILGRAYGDFERIPNAMGHLQLMGVEPRFTLAAAHKSSSDIALSLDALEVLLTREEINHFVIMAGDRDYLPIIRRIRERANEVWVVGFERNTSADLRNVAGQNRFIKADNFIPAPPITTIVEGPVRSENEVPEPTSDSAMMEEENTCLRLLLDAQQTYKNPEIWLSPFMQNYMNQSFSYLDRFGRRKLIERLEGRGLVRIEKRQGNPYDYSVIVVNEEATRLALAAEPAKDHKGADEADRPIKPDGVLRLEPEVRSVAVIPEA